MIDIIEKKRKEGF